MGALLIMPGQPDEAAVGGSRSGKERLSLTRRGRRVVAALGFALAALLGFIGGRAEAASVPSPPETVTVVVMPGDTLWSLAREVTQSREDIRDVVLEIKWLNGLGSSALRAGEVIKLPVPDGSALHAFENRA